MIGHTVSRYTIVSKLGGGGMGVVYEAEDAELGRRVAIKFLPEKAGRSAHALDRFKREARAASALNHPHICRVHDIGVYEGKPFLVMERLRGETVKAAIERQALSIEKITSRGEQIADALDAAHRAASSTAISNPRISSSPSATRQRSSTSVWPRRPRARVPPT